MDLGISLRIIKYRVLVFIIIEFKLLITIIVTMKLLDQLYFKEILKKMY